MKFTPAAEILTTASLGLGFGTGRSTGVRTSGPPVFWTWMARMVPLMLQGREGIAKREKSPESREIERESRGIGKDTCPGICFNWPITHALPTDDGDDARCRRFRAITAISSSPSSPAIVLR